MKKIVFIFMLRFELVPILLQKNIMYYVMINISTNNSSIIDKSIQFLIVTCSVDGQVAVTDTVQNKNVSTCNEGQWKGRLWNDHKKSVLKYFYRPERPLGLQEGEDPRISKQWTHEDNKVVSPTYRPPLPPGVTPGTHFC